MRFFQFLKWWWRKSDNFTRTIFPTLIFWVLPCFFMIPIFGQYAVLAAAIGIFIIFSGYGIYGFYYLLNEYWKEFNKDEPTEDIMIINRLKGSNTK